MEGQKQRKIQGARREDIKYNMITKKHLPEKWAGAFKYVEL